MVIWTELVPPSLDDVEENEIKDRDENGGKTYLTKTDIVIEEVTDQSLFPKTDYFDV